MKLNGKRQTGGFKSLKLKRANQSVRLVNSGQDSTNANTASQQFLSRKPSSRNDYFTMLRSNFEEYQQFEK